MGNRHPLEEAIKKEMGAQTTVVHKIGLPFTVQSDVNGKAGERECLPMYYNTPGCIASKICPGALEKTAKKAAAAGTPASEEMFR
mmetsp:Transcript_44040/g.115721  ORF Transcript_44040/g.115721 Transcript_44040/m.115721 type:complete len:85 (+) Transcript_44040:145-399(+)